VVGLNPSQQEAVEHRDGPLLVLAGAGSGKTRVVTQRIARLLEQGVASRAILAMTFTNKAAAEMRERVVGLVGAKIAKDLHVSTFHRFGLHVLGQETRALGLRGNQFAIFDQADAMGVVREILRTLKTGKNYDVSAIVARISNAKNAFVDVETWREKQRNGPGIDDYDEISMEVFPKYQAALQGFQAFDFDDLICEVVNLWKRRPDCLERWQQRFRYVIVDEYQDTNHAQLELVRLIGGDRKNVCVVGDDDQSIYAWRGADVKNILDFEQHFSGAKVVKLQENYRSFRPVLELANAVLSKSGARRHKKVLVPTREGGELPDVVIAADADVEASFVAEETKRILEEGLLRPRDVAVLYRSNLQAQPIEAALKERQIPLRMIGGQQFFERKEVKDLLAYMRVAIRPDDEMSLRRILNYPARGIGDAAVGKLGSYATAHDTSLWAAVSKAHAVFELAPAALEGCRQLQRIVENARTKLDGGIGGADLARHLAEEIGLKADIQASSTTLPAAARRWTNVEGIIGVFQRRDEAGKGDRERLAEFLRLLALRQDGDEQEATDRVTLTTMHGAKGLEFKVVFVVGLEEGLMPHARTLDERATDAQTEDGATSLEEERRLFYVAVTRARDKLFLCRCKTRAMRGKIMPRTPSRFVLELPPELVHEREELVPIAPALDKTVAGASGVLAALFGAGNESGEIPFVPRRRS
jgi:DNA helicase-2/ATP-dependent DNA helicase PcrA